MLQVFLECYYYESLGIYELDSAINNFQSNESKDKKLEFRLELKVIIENSLYEKASYLIKKYSGRRLSFKKTELFLNYIYNKLCNITSDIKITDLK